MAEIIGLGLTHYPGLRMVDADATIFLRNTLKGGRVSAHDLDPKNWPAAMREEWADDEGAAAAALHRERCAESIVALREELDAFAPDFIVIFGDDQYENFTEDMVPPFCVFVLDDIESRPYSSHGGPVGAANFWGETPDTVFRHKGHADGARFMLNGLSESGRDVAYAYRLRYGPGLAHAFINTLLYLDWNRTGFDHPVVPFHVNCYGSQVIRARGGVRAPGQEAGPPDPPSPSARACWDMGADMARVLRDSPYRVALVASSSWSHAFLSENTGWIYPDHDSDRARFEELRTGDYAAWRDLDRHTLEAAGQHEILNWVCLAGAMAEIGARPRFVDYVESWVLNSNKCFAVFAA
jgi:hypothetical protein